MRRAALIGAGLLVGALAAAWALRAAPLPEVARALAAADPLALLLPAALFLGQQALRAYRQAVLVRASAPAHRFGESHAILCVSFFFVNTLPARLGEALRPALLHRVSGLGWGAALAVVLAERAVDLGAMFVLLGVLAWRAPAFAAVPGWSTAVRPLVAVGLPLVLLALGGLIFGGEAAVSALGPRLPARLRALLHALAAGFGALRDRRRAATVLALTVATWALTAALYPATAAALGFGERLSWADGLGVLGAIMAGMALPAAPGFAGTYEAAVLAGLAAHGIHGPAPVVPGGPSADAAALAFALLVHWGIFLVQSATAAISAFAPAFRGGALRGAWADARPGTPGGATGGGVAEGAQPPLPPV
jgi:uncharacterized protein (TIRG00374 family)